ncbi:MAG TPA: NrfD/PsrC family molybdoenzyme membrane anchor subunit, partial [Pseudonocardia sp.]
RFLGIDLGVLGTLVAPALGVLGAGVTGLLLVTDLKRPERFHYLFTKPNPRSWLVLGAVVLLVFGAVAGLWLLTGVLSAAGVIGSAHGPLGVLAVLAVPASALAAGYTGFLFGQAEGRDLWQSPLLFWHLIVQAVMVGAGALAVAALVSPPGATATVLIARSLVLATAVHVLMLLLEFGGRHRGAHAAAAARLVVRGRYARLFWTGGVLLALVAAALAVAGWAGGFALLVALGGAAVQIALLSYESVFVRAGQDIPLS